MPKFQDLIGQTFNYLTVINRAPNRKKITRWACRCICGNITIVDAQNLKVGRTKSCGCRQYTVLAEQHTKDEVGNRFGRLVAVELIRHQKIVNGKKDGNNIYFKCVCDCGNSTEVWCAHLRNGSTQSCGCLRDDLTRKANTTHGLSATKEYMTAKTRKRRERMKNLDSSWTLEMEVFLRNLFQHCVICGITEQEHQKKYNLSLHVDHVRPLSGGHGLKPGNATVLCISCNATKQAKQLEDLPAPMHDRILETSELFQLLWNGVM